MSTGKKINLENADASYIRIDRMLYEKNKQSSSLAVLAIVFNALFFVSIYKSNIGSWYYTLLIGVSIVYNLLFMMITFLISEGSKNYKVNFSYAAIVVGILQFVRIFIYPRMAHAAETQTNDGVVNVMGNAQYIRVVLYLVISGVCLIVSALIGIKKCAALNGHINLLQKDEK